MLAWLNAGISRSTKMPKLSALIKDKSQIKDPAFKLAAIKASLPKMTMAEWRARQG
ncbi:hypothetical protein [Thioclava kandeliae]|uniref:Uncharacterized protein n=1 Tax=Thioclava kandeliae TaxID=3070818 RepID=A0ABV1SFA8_9RHOB